MEMEKPIFGNGIFERLANNGSKYDLTSFLNNHSTKLMIGRPRSWKTSLLYSFLKSKELLRNVYDKIFLFQPEQSRNSMKDKLFDNIPDEQKFDILNLENLNECGDKFKWW